MVDFRYILKVEIKNSQNSLTERGILLGCKKYIQFASRDCSQLQIAVEDGIFLNDSILELKVVATLVDDDDITVGSYKCKLPILPVHVAFLIEAGNGPVD